MQARSNVQLQQCIRVLRARCGGLCRASKKGTGNGGNVSQGNKVLPGAGSQPNDITDIILDSILDGRRIPGLLGGPDDDDVPGGHVVLHVV